MQIPPTERPSLQFTTAEFKQLNSPPGLEAACTEIAQLLLPRFGELDVADTLDWLACRVRSRQTSHDRQSLLAHLHHVLFEEEEFRGNLESYYVIENQLITSVLARRQGMPVTLALIYKRVADRLGLRAEGLNTPGHFLVRVHDGFGWIVVDPFCAGRVMSEAEAIKRLVNATGWDASSMRRNFEPIQPIDWLRRCLLSLQNGLRRSGQTEQRQIIDQALADVEALGDINS